ncbi:MAG: hypothetical protein ACLUHN_09395 [Evtepia gabavorous]
MITEENGLGSHAAVVGLSLNKAVCGGHWSHPDPARRDEGLHGLPAGVCAELGGVREARTQRKPAVPGDGSGWFLCFALRRWNGRGALRGFSYAVETAGNLGLPSQGPFLGKKWKEPQREEVLPSGLPSLVGLCGGGCTSYGIPGLRPSQ